MTDDVPSTASKEVQTGQIIVSRLGKSSAEELLSTPGALDVLDKVGKAAEANGDWEKYGNQFNPYSRSHNLSFSSDPHLSDTQRLGLTVIQNEFAVGKLPVEKIQMLQDIGHQYLTGQVSFAAQVPATTHAGTLTPSQQELQWGKDVLSSIAGKANDDLANSPQAQAILEKIGKVGEENGDWEKYGKQFNPSSRSHNQWLSSDPHLSDTQQLGLKIIKDQLLNPNLTRQQREMIQDIGGQNPGGALPAAGNDTSVNDNVRKLAADLNTGGVPGLTFVADGSRVSADLTDAQYQNMQKMAALAKNDKTYQKLSDAFGGNIDFDPALPVNPTTGKHMLVVTNVQQAISDPTIMQSYKDSARVSTAVLAGDFTNAQRMMEAPPTSLPKGHAELALPENTRRSNSAELKQMAVNGTGDNRPPLTAAQSGAKDNALPKAVSAPPRRNMGLSV